MNNTVQQPNTQEKNIFKDHAYIIHEKGIPCVPLEGKIPVLKNWQKYQKENVPDVVFHSWEVQHKDKNIGLILGEQSGLVAVDYDAIEPNKEIESIIPRSMVERFGKKGFVRFFRFNGERSRKFQHIQVEILSSGNQVVLPPSIHPDTKQPYKWTSVKTIYDIDPDDLEPLPAGFIEQLEQLNEAAKKENKRNGHKANMDNLGRNNTLFSQCSAMVGEGVRREVIKERLVRFDQENHKTPWFTDPTEPHRGDQERAVDEMIERAAELDGDYTGEALLSKENLKDPEEKILISELKKASLERSKNSLPIKFKDFPEPTGVLKSMRDFCLELSHIKREKFALAAACELVGLILSNRVTLNKVAPPLYQLLIAESGEGKDAPLKFPKEVLLRTHQFGFLGLSSYRGDKSVVKRFDSQLERIDTIDEISKLFRQMNGRNASHLSSVAELLTELWTSSNKFFEGFTTSEGTVGLCHSPCLSLFGATTPSAFSNSFGSANIMQGFGARFLYIHEKEVGDIVFNDDDDSTYIPAEIKFFIDYWVKKCPVKTEPINVEDMGLKQSGITLGQLKKDAEAGMIKTIKKVIPRKLKTTQEAKELLQNLVIEYKDLKYKVPPMIKPLVLRAYENTLKIAQIHWASRTYEIIMNLEPGKDIQDKELLKCIQVEDVNFARQYVEAALCEASNLFDETIIESEFHKQSIEIKKVIEAAGGEISKSELTMALRRRFKAKELYGPNGIVNSMIDAALIEEVELEKASNGRVPKAYKIIN